jgi:hypothetical protein
MAAAVGFYLLTGHPPFSGSGSLDERQRPPLDQIPNRALAAVLGKAMAFNPADRYQSSADFLNALRPFAV